MMKAILIRITVLVLALGACATALAQSGWQRTLPKGKVGVLGEPAPLPTVQVDGENLRFAPGAVIYDQANRTIVHAALPAYAKVLYTTNANGEVQRIYILTPDEQLALERAGRR
jgi:hypothetical protein